MRKTLFFLLLATAIVLQSCTDNESRLIKKAARIHEKALTVDSHVDTPMELTRSNFDFGINNRDSSTRSKVDLPRMEEGGLDGIFFAVFVGQGELTDSGRIAAREEADEILDSIYSTMAKYQDKLELAVNSKDLARIEKSGKKAIFLGMENGYPVGTDIALLDTFYNKGIRYITICHSYYNDICDSSTDSAMYHGLSGFGREVVKRMNNLGMMIDLSHASDETFYQVLELSDKPIIASHSCARALCDNPRNLTDDMLLKLKDNGGVIQMCILSSYIKTPSPNPQRDSARNAVRLKYGKFYELDEAGRQAFLKEWYKLDVDFPRELATVADVVDHIDHIVEVAGIDHVGIGTDFDGGGYVDDCRDVSELGNITLELVRRGYSAREIKKIWGGNLMRVLGEVEEVSD